jgi:hypothetical protein
MSKLTKIVAVALGGLTLATALVATQADARSPNYVGSDQAGGPRLVVLGHRPGQPGPDPAYVRRAAGHRR